MSKFVFLCVFVLNFMIIGHGQIACAFTMVSVSKGDVNLRSGPGTHYKVLWVLGKGCPLKVIKSRGNWYKVEDFEGDAGWIYKPLTSRTPHVVVKKQIVNIRSMPGTENPVVAKAKKGTVFQTIGSIKGWIKVRHERGITGWVARRLVWGW